jgi:hypothetical protein
VMQADGGMVLFGNNSAIHETWAGSQEPSRAGRPELIHREHYAGGNAATPVALWHGEFTSL